jgi:hypothetical protein
MADISVTFTSGRLGKSNFRRQLFVTPHIIAGLGLKPADHPTYKVYIANFPPDKDGDDPSGADQHNLDAPESQQLRVGMLLVGIEDEPLRGIEYQEVTLNAPFHVRAC